MSLFSAWSPDEDDQSIPFPSAQQSSAASSVQGVKEDEVAEPGSISSSLLLGDSFAQSSADSQTASEISEFEDEALPLVEGAQQIRTSRTRRWLRHTASEREIVEGLDLADTRDLTRHVLNAHGIAARQYSRVCPDLSLLNPRNYWVPEWIPLNRWAAFPNLPDEVPRRQEQVWASSITKNEVWRPGRDLEDALFAVMLRKGTRQWDKREREVSTNGDNAGVDNESSESSSSIMTANVIKIKAGPSSRNIASVPRKRKHDEVDDADEPVLCADDERQWRLLKPSVKSILTNFDKLLLALHQSKCGSSKYLKGKSRNAPPTDRNSSDHNPNSPDAVESATSDSEPGESDNISGREQQKRTQKRNFRREFQPTAHLRPSAPRDWSQVLGFSSIIGISPAVISRATIRCTAAFGEGMSFQQMAEKDAVTTTATFKPSDVLNQPLELKFTPQEIQATVRVTWDYDTVTKCPFPQCSWVLPDSTPEKKIKSRLGDHFRRTHRVEDPKKGMHEIPAEKDSAVHIDGFMQPIQTPKGQRGKGKKWSSPQVIPTEYARIKGLVRGPRPPSGDMEVEGID